MNSAIILTSRYPVANFRRTSWRLATGRSSQASGRPDALVLILTLGSHSDSIASKPSAWDQTRSIDLT